MIVRYWFTSQYPSDEMISYYQGDSKGSTHSQGKRGGGEEEERRRRGEGEKNLCVWGAGFLCQNFEFTVDLELDNYCEYNIEVVPS